MAGSYTHIALGGWSDIENMGDAAELTQQLLWLVERKIGRLEAFRLIETEFYPMKRGEIPKDKAWTFAQRMMHR